jgi:hypothetical protein
MKFILNLKNISATWLKFGRRYRENGNVIKGKQTKSLDALDQDISTIFMGFLMLLRVMNE